MLQYFHISADVQNVQNASSEYAAKDGLTPRCFLLATIFDSMQ